MDDPGNIMEYMYIPSLELGQLHTVSFRARNNRNNKKYNKRPGFIPGWKLLAIK